MSMRAADSPPAATRGRLSRQRVLEVALDYADRNGLEALSMHKLGAELGVKAMSLYNHVANKDDLLNGIADLLWSQVTPPPQEADSWQQVVRTLAASLRDVIQRHPNAAHLLASTQALSEHSLLLADAYRAVLTETGLPDECAVAFLRTVISYALGQSLAELTWARATGDGADADDPTRIRRISDMLPPQASGDLVRIATWFCAECDMAQQFDLGINLMIRGLDTVLAEAPNDMPSQTEVDPVEQTARVWDQRSWCS
jgi:AcrR family transcriptional regulator